MKVVPYINFNGDCAEAFTFYADVLGGKIEAMMTHADSPIADHVPATWGNLILNARLAIGDQILMASDSSPERYQRPQGFYVSLQIDQAADAERIFNALAENGTVTMPFEKTFWASGGFGMLVDRFGTPWMINCEADGAQGE
ncbi:MAG: VOC family protein [Chloroflexi bacterium]|nr:VOC family protein [Chloroflexota bacterium]